MNIEIDPVEFGKLLGQVEAIAKSVDTLTVKVEGIEKKLNKGRGFIAGLTLATAAIGGGIGAFVHKIMENVK